MAIFVPVLNINGNMSMICQEALKGIITSQKYEIRGLVYATVIKPFPTIFLCLISNLTDTVNTSAALKSILTAV